MADEADIAGSENSFQNVILDDTLALIRARAAHIPAGEEGDCQECGLYFTRLVRGYCGKCRDELHIH